VNAATALAQGLTVTVKGTVNSRYMPTQCK